GRISYLRAPSGPGIRDDGGVYGGWVVSQFYDPLISKVCAWAPRRDQAIARLHRALGEYTVHGIAVNLRYLRAVLEHPAFRSGDYDTGFCAAHAKELVPPPDARHEEVALIAAAVAAHRRDRDQTAAFAARSGEARARSTWRSVGRARELGGGRT
ncbi:MAG TPA: acetyl-CoA carboxylase biotin carboxylase subunit, partial [Anaeromyxobacteraceae bacterium]